MRGILQGKNLEEQQNLLIKKESEKCNSENKLLKNIDSTLCHCKMLPSGMFS